MRTIKSAIFATLAVFAGLFASVAQATSMGSPFALIEALYPEGQQISPFSFEVADSGLKNLLIAENRNFAKTSKSFFKFNPVCGCVGKWSVQSRQAVYTELSDNFVMAQVNLQTTQGPLTVEVSLRRQAQSWFVSDFRYLSKAAAPWSLQSQLRQYLGI